LQLEFGGIDFDREEVLANWDWRFELPRKVKEGRKPKEARSKKTKPKKMSKTFTPADVATHKDASSGLYIIIDDGVYDVTSTFPLPPLFSFSHS
jgi:cytochrome b involved in lipid metabolism